MRLIVLPRLAVAVGTAVAAAALGCGGSEGLSDDAVAEVGGTVIAKSDFESALKFATGRGNDPRDYAACIRAKRQPAGESGGTQPADAELEQQCREEYQRIKSNVMKYLIEAEWARQEAEARGIVLTEAEVGEAVDQAKAGGLLDAETLTRAGVSERQLMVRLRHSRLQTKVIEHVSGRPGEVTAEDVAAYYRRNEREVTVPYLRKARLVITRTRAKAEAARAALGAGRSWASVAREYSIHASREDGGSITAEWKREDKEGFGAALFRARRGDLVGPVKNGDTWALFVADRMKRSYRPPLGQMRDEIETLLTSRRREQALAAFTRRYRAKTTCAPGFEVPACENGPEQSDDEPSA